MVLKKHFLPLAAVVFLLAGCASEIGVRENSVSGRRNYSVADLTTNELNGNTVNLLSNFLLHDLFRNEPEQLIVQLEQLYRKNRDVACVAALADTSLRIGYRLQSEPDRSCRFFLASAVYSGLYLKLIDDDRELYDEQRIRFIRINNLAMTELFCYLKERGLERKSGFELAMPGNIRNVRFDVPQYVLPIPENELAQLQPCAHFSTRNLTHDTRVFGLGVPLVASIKPGSRDVGGILIPGLPIAVTLVGDFDFEPTAGKVSARLRYIYSRTQSHVKLGKHSLPLAADFSTPLAKAAGAPQKKNFLRRTFKVKEAKEFTGLYHLEPFDDKRIPIVFVHGLMSDIRTWGQMLNTLLHDKTIREKYQFLGFAYSSGNPIFVSGAILRKELQDLRQKLLEQKRSTEAFDKMVLVGHSMGGLLSRMQITSSSTEQVAAVLGIEDLEAIRKEFAAEQFEKALEVVNFKPLPFVKRVIFIAVPHRGSQIAESWIGRLGSALIELPAELVRRNLRAKNANYTGIDNLKPGNAMLKVLGELKFAENLPCHSIMGNQEKAYTPGGSDGVVPYWSSHLDHAVSELVVKSGHSAHRNPLAIQEVRRILLLHVKP